MKTKILFFLLACLMLIGCSQTVFLKKSTKGSFYNKLNRIAFKERSTYTINLGEHSEKTAVSLFSAPQIIQCNISISGIDCILYVKLIESELLNIDRHMIRGQEFLFDERNGVLQVLLDLPLIYLLHGSVAFSIEILMLNSEESYVKSLKKSIAFNWKPLKKHQDGQTGFAYADPLTDRKYVGKAEIKNQIRNELTNTNIDRFDMKYKNAILHFIK